MANSLGSVADKSLQCAEADVSPDCLGDLVQPLDNCGALQTALNYTVADRLRLSDQFSVPLRQAIDPPWRNFPEDLPALAR